MDDSMKTHLLECIHDSTQNDDLSKKAFKLSSRYPNPIGKTVTPHSITESMKNLILTYNESSVLKVINRMKALHLKRKAYTSLEDADINGKVESNNCKDADPDDAFIDHREVPDRKTNKKFKLKRKVLRTLGLHIILRFIITLRDKSKRDPPDEDHSTAEEVFSTKNTKIKKKNKKKRREDRIRGEKKSRKRKKLKKSISKGCKYMGAGMVNGTTMMPEFYFPGLLSNAANYRREYLYELPNQSFLYM